jgi:LAS superfamily LD-carboxypeptidase LdcB
VSAIHATRANIVGQSDTHLCSAGDTAVIGAPVHADAVAPLLGLRAAAAAEGFDLAVLSGFRNFDRQLSIWNRKASGQLAVLDTHAKPIDINTLASADLALAILRWSALPGGSRHHWGTDVDVYDLAAKPAGYEVDLVPAEVDAGGMFAPFHEWLDARIAERAAFGFFRPYDADRRGVAPERWHLSYAPVATACAQLLTRDVLRETITNAEMMLKGAVLANLDEIFERFVTNVNPVSA